MIFGVYSIRDALTGFMAPVCELSDAVAVRNFSSAVSDGRPGQVMHFRPSDFSLYRIGDFDSESGSIVSFPVPSLLITAESAIGG